MRASRRSIPSVTYLNGDRMKKGSELEHGFGTRLLLETNRVTHFLAASHVHFVGYALCYAYGSHSTWLRASNVGNVIQIGMQ